LGLSAPAARVSKQGAARVPIQRAALRRAAPEEVCADAGRLTRRLARAGSRRRSFRLPCLVRTVKRDAVTNKLDVALLPKKNRRILIIDDTPAIHEDFKKVLGAVRPVSHLE